MTMDQVKRKFTALANPVIGEERTRAAAAAFLSVGDVPDVRALPW